MRTSACVDGPGRERRSVPSNVTEYSRSRWKPWADKDVECQDARHKFLTGVSKDDGTYNDGKR